MANTKKEYKIEDLLLLIGGLWVLTRLFKTPAQAGIGALPNAERRLRPYVSGEGIEAFKEDVQQFDRNETGEIIRMIIEARLRTDLSMPFFKTLKGTIVSGELRHGHWRIFVYVLSNEDFLMLSVFKKKTNETPKNELQKAERRLREYLTR